MMFISLMIRVCSIVNAATLPPFGEPTLPAFGGTSFRFYESTSFPGPKVKDSDDVWRCSKLVSLRCGSVDLYKIVRVGKKLFCIWVPYENKFLMPEEVKPESRIDSVLSLYCKLGDPYPDATNIRPMIAVGKFGNLYVFGWRKDIHILFIRHVYPSEQKDRLPKSD